MVTRKKKPTRAKVTPEQRIAEYVDSPMMTHRLRQGKTVSARILGNYGTYCTEISTAKRSKQPNGTCTCPSDWQPCKHVYALQQTWELKPASFFDLDQWLAELFEWPKSRLVDAIAKVIERNPECLNDFEVPAFEFDSNDGEDDWND